MQTKLKGGLMKGIRRRLAGESIFMTNFACQDGIGTITFASEFPGKILTLDMSKIKEIICQKDAFLCAQETVNMDMIFRKKLGAGLFGGEGFILQKLTGKGLAFVEISGEVIEYNLKKGQTIRVDTGHLAIYEPQVDYDVQLMRGARNILFGGEGLFLATLKGPGKVWLQSMPIKKLAAKISAYTMPGRHYG
jgi:uncharacterized protein (TIGR00266 family)